MIWLHGIEKHMPLLEEKHYNIPISSPAVFMAIFNWRSYTRWQLGVRLIRTQMPVVWWCCHKKQISQRHLADREMFKCGTHFCHLRHVFSKDSQWGHRSWLFTDLDFSFYGGFLLAIPCAVENCLSLSSSCQQAFLVHGSAEKQRFSTLLILEGLRRWWQQFIQTYQMHLIPIGY